MFLNSLGPTNLSQELYSAPFTKQQYIMETMSIRDKTDLMSQISILILSDCIDKYLPNAC